MALILVFVNKSNLAKISDYHVQVLVGDGTAERSDVISQGTVLGHERAKGWQELVQRYLDESNYQDK